MEAGTFSSKKTERSASNQHSLDSFVLLPVDNTLRSHVRTNARRGRALVCLAPCGWRMSIISSRGDINSEAICRVRTVRSDVYDMFLDLRVMAVTFISAIRQLVPADYLPLNTAVTRIKIIKIHGSNIQPLYNTILMNLLIKGRADSRIINAS